MQRKNQYDLAKCCGNDDAIVMANGVPICLVHSDDNEKQLYIPRPNSWSSHLTLWVSSVLSFIHCWHAFCLFLLLMPKADYHFSMQPGGVKIDSQSKCIQDNMPKWYAAFS